MPNIISAKKRLRQNTKRRERNRVAKASLRTVLKKADQAIETAEKEEAYKVVLEASRKLDKVAQKRIVHPNMASRKKSRLMKKFNKKFAS